MKRPQFSLRTLLIVVALFGCAAGWIGIEMRKVAERNRVYQESVLGENVSERVEVSPPEIWLSPAGSNPLPWYRKLLGDFHVKEIRFSGFPTAEEVERIKQVFPEAEVKLLAGDQERGLFSPSDR